MEQDINSTEAKFQITAIDKLIPYARNARTHSKEQIAKIAASIREFKFINPVIMDKEGGIIAGHGRVLAARQLGMDKVPTLMVDHLTEAQKRAYILADNRMALDAGWDEDMLAVELSELKDEEFDLSLTGFDEDEIADYLNDPADGLTDEDEIAEPPADPVSVLGDTWIMGSHRVRCGDSTKAEDVTALLGEIKPHLMVTDPPYGVEYDPDWRNRADRADGTPIGGFAIGTVCNDEKHDWTEAWKLFPGNIAYVWHASNHASSVQQSLENCDFKIRNQIIWAKQQFAISRGDYHWQHEPCWYAVKGTGNWKGDRKQTTLWEIDKPQKSETGHSTQKPVECMRRPMLNNSSPGQAVYDPFLGSGTTVIAAESEGRHCLGMELNPAYVDVIVQRWEKFTGKKAVHENGQSFEQIAESRQKKAA